jgi:hypothetical protein
VVAAKTTKVVSEVFMMANVKVTGTLRQGAVNCWIYQWLAPPCRNVSGSTGKLKRTSWQWREPRVSRQLRRRFSK